MLAGVCRSIVLLYNYNMSLSVVGNPFYAYRKPPEWDGIVAAIGQSVDGALPYHAQHKAAVTAVAEIQKLDNERIADNGIYAKGMLACKFAQVLYTPEGEESFRSQVVDEIIRHQKRSPGRRPDGDGLMMGNFGLMGLTTGRPYLPAQPLPLPERVAANAFSSMNLACDNEVSQSKYPTRILEDHGSRSLQSAARDGANILLRAVLERIYNVGHGLPPKQLLPGDVLLRDIVDTNELRKMQLEKLYAVGAGMRIGDLFALARDLVVVGADGTIDADPNVVPKKDELVVREQYSRQGRYRCPALFVEGLIPLMSHIVPETLADAQDKLMAGA